MSTTHIVEQGEHLSGIAADYGFPSHLPIWNHGQNEKLRQERQNPNILFPGDALFIPDIEQRFESRSTGATHSFVSAAAEKLVLRVVIQDESAEAVAGVDYVLQVGSDVDRKKTSASGSIEKVIPPDAKEGRLIVQPTDLAVDLDVTINIGHLDPETEVTGQIARLNNLGYDAGEVQSPADDDARLQFRSAVEEFQCNCELPVDGACDENTQAKLKEVHGC